MFCSLLEWSCSFSWAVTRNEGDIICWCPGVLFSFFLHTHCRDRSAIVSNKQMREMSSRKDDETYSWNKRLHTFSFLRDTSLGRSSSCSCPGDTCPWADLGLLLRPMGEDALRLYMSSPEELGAWLGWEGSWRHGLSLSMKLSRHSSEVMWWDRQ